MINFPFSLWYMIGEEEKRLNEEELDREHRQNLKEIDKKYEAIIKKINDGTWTKDD